jgi:hypothetical protein
MPDIEIKRLMRGLGESITDALNDSPQVNDSIQKIRDAGYEVHLVIDTRIGFNRKTRGGETEAGAGAPKSEEPVRLRITSEDAKFLKSLKIAVDSDV